MNALFSLTFELVSFIKKYKTHILVWSIFILYESLMAGLISGVFGKLGNYAVHYAINIALFYINAHVVLPNALKKPRRAFFRLPVALGLLIVSYVLFVFYIDILLVRYTDFLTLSELQQKFWHRFVWRGLYFVGFSTGYYYLITYLKERNRVNKLETEKLNSEIEHEKIQTELVRTQNAFLKAQINPHFLFNTLSFMHSQTQKSAPRVAETILSLSEMMRYSLKNENLDEEAELTEEIEQAENLIRLHQLRSDNQLYIQMALKGDLSEIKIIPLILITLAENMFKHGNLHNPLCPALFHVELQNEDLLIKTENLINRQKHAVSFNLGLANIKRRLELKYPGAFSFEHYQDEHNYFHTRLVIQSICPS